MGRMVDGEWTTQWYIPDRDGKFQRPETVFRNVVGEFEPGRFHLYVSFACPWAHRTLIARTLHGLGDAIGVSVVASFMGDDGWTFEAKEEGATGDSLYDSKFMREIYKRSDEAYTGRVTVPVLWDTQNETIVNNESIELVKMFDAFGESVGSDTRLFPEDLEKDVRDVVNAIYEPINNGVYRCGFAGSQSAYDDAFEELFAALDHWEEVLGDQRYLCGNRLTAADVCLFTTLVRFDSVYHTHFKTNRNRIVDFPNLWGFLRDVYAIDGIAETVNMEHIKGHYFGSHTSINPTRIVARGPVIDFSTPHDRDRIGI